MAGDESRQTINELLPLILGALCVMCLPIERRRAPDACTERTGLHGHYRVGICRQAPLRSWQKLSNQAEPPQPTVVLSSQL